MGPVHGSTATDICHSHRVTPRLCLSLPPTENKAFATSSISLKEKHVNRFQGSITYTACQESIRRYSCDLLTEKIMFICCSCCRRRRCCYHYNQSFFYLSYDRPPKAPVNFVNYKGMISPLYLHPSLARTFRMSPTCVHCLITSTVLVSLQGNGNGFWSQL